MSVNEDLHVIRAIEKHNCKELLRLNTGRMLHFVLRMKQRGYSPNDVVVTCINVDDPNGGPIADLLMPGQDWQAFRDQGQIPIARGLAGREGIQTILQQFDCDAADKLQRTPGIAIVVIDRGVAEIFTPEDIEIQ